MKQKDAFELLKLGYNVFLTGAAGSGKTYLLNQYIAHLREHGVLVAVTASTGVAATHLGGQTIHSWSGIGVRDSASDDELEELAQKERVRKNVCRAAVLVIDEVSMLHAHQLDMVNRLARYARGNSAPFGGLQVILCGDFFQLPPVGRSMHEVEPVTHDAFGYDDGGNGKTFAYECRAWEDGGFQVCYLDEQYRQGDDLLLSVLSAIRKGRAGEEAKAPLRTRWRKEPKGGVRPTRLYARNMNVDAINAKELEALAGKTHVFRMQARGFQALVDALKRSCLAPETLHLKENAEVIFVKNSVEGKYVNGTRGTVVGFAQKGDWPIVRTFDGHTIVSEPEEWRLEENGSVRATLTQVPLRLAWAITIHKSQGMTLDAAEVDLSDAFEPGMGYVALSRMRTLAGLKLLGLNEVALEVHPKILSHDAKFREWSDAACAALSSCAFEEVKKKQDEALFTRFSGTRDKEKVKAKRVDKEKQKKAKIPTHEITRALIDKKLSIKDIAKERGVTQGTIIGHLEKLQGLGLLPDISHLKPKIKDFDAIVRAFKKSDTGALTPIFKQFKGTHSFELLRLIRLFA